MTVVWSKVESKINSLLKGLPLDRSSDPKSHARIDHSSDHRKSNSSQECMIPQIMKWPCGVTPVLEPSSFTPVLEPFNQGSMILEIHDDPTQRSSVKNQTTSQGLRKQVDAQNIQDSRPKTSWHFSKFSSIKGGFTKRRTLH